MTPADPIISALTSLGSAGILGLVIVQLFYKLMDNQGTFRMYLINQNTILQTTLQAVLDQNRMLIKIVDRVDPAILRDMSMSIYPRVDTKLD